ncbi:50S ribosomal protein L21 [Candidatus Kuenenbacteria bacterium CG23_combo_of_CG06-09_8_20_14_all_36_9]|uniref:Large ribosomal subunit protein bL21 n=1 Tax=Candidatus Kuenenbacteria bacterium CG10_big_fil_rev_8_21_14_0_10_36_11 TaxID=1974618 RepID=A0A2M6WA49_9BACT|nr:MAG: 50S ribosomal protein L21 [Candidatus Kuenenbacteria bacterium CG23_combo_of_CG06-09_8_20_14_all_36_9]PIT89692.1 MAG: 50S ribosomal protein L21 [Candidatus Kuenenbacteria bacterium CG10_big_fil_rev_8_21_14_0_10_36_11]
MKLAVIKTGGKQYIVREGAVLKVEKLLGENGNKIKFSDVLMVADDKTLAVELGNPFLKDSVVEAEILAQGRTKKIRVLHYKPKTRERKVYGHRQPFTQVKIEKIT